MIRVTVKFEPDDSGPLQGVALLAFEKHLRELTGEDVRVFKNKLGDDSKLRIMMSKVERESL